MQGPDMHQARYGLDMVSLNCIVFALGGQEDPQSPLGTVEMWDTRTVSVSNIWMLSSLTSSS